MPKADFAFQSRLRVRWAEAAPLPEDLRERILRYERISPRVSPESAPRA